MIDRFLKNLISYVVLYCNLRITWDLCAFLRVDNQNLPYQWYKMVVVVMGDSWVSTFKVESNYNHWLVISTHHIDKKWNFGYVWIENREWHEILWNFPPFPAPLLGVQFSWIISHRQIYRLISSCSCWCYRAALMANDANAAVWLLLLYPGDRCLGSMVVCCYWKPCVAYLSSRKYHD